MLIQVPLSASARRVLEARVRTDLGAEGWLRELAAARIAAGQERAVRLAVEAGLAGSLAGEHPGRRAVEALLAAGQLERPVPGPSRPAASSLSVEVDDLDLVAWGVASAPLTPAAEAARLVAGKLEAALDDLVAEALRRDPAALTIEAAGDDPAARLQALRERALAVLGERGRGR